MKNIKLAPEKKRNTKHKRRSIIIVALILSVSLFILTQLSAAPFNALIRFTNKRQVNSVNLGPYQNEITSVLTPEILNLKHKSLPDSQISISRPKDQGASNLPVIFFIHGGGWTIGSATQVEDFAKLLAAQGFVVVSLDYALAPEHHYPAPIIQASDALNYLQANHKDLKLDMNRLYIGGNSAGAQIASQLGVMITNPDYKSQLDVTINIKNTQVEGMILLNGVFNFDTVAKDNFPGFKMFAWNYTGQKNYQNYDRLDELSTRYHLTKDFPKTFITAGDADPLEAQSYQFDATLRSNHVEVQSVYWTGTDSKLPHDYLFDLRTDAAQRSFKILLDFLKK